MQIKLKITLMELDYGSAKVRIESVMGDTLKHVPALPTYDFDLDPEEFIILGPIEFEFGNKALDAVQFDDEGGTDAEL